MFCGPDIGETPRRATAAVRAREDGQTMAEVGVVLSVITVATVTVFTALSGGVIEAAGRAADLLPG